MLEKLWMRDGDAGDYTDFDTLDDVALLLLRLGVTEYDTRPAGIEAVGFRGNNYISLYWGTERPDLVRELSAVEHDLLRRRLKGECG